MVVFINVTKCLAESERKPGVRFSKKTRKLYGPEKPFIKLRPAYSVKLVFSYVVKGIKVKITANFGGTGHLHFEDTKRIMSPEVLGLSRNRPQIMKFTRMGHFATLT